MGADIISLSISFISLPHQEGDEKAAVGLTGWRGWQGQQVRTREEPHVSSTPTRTTIPRPAADQILLSMEVEPHRLPSEEAEEEEETLPRDKHGGRAPPAFRGGRGGGNPTT